jgi:hypothetical protein
MLLLSEITYIIDSHAVFTNHSSVFVHVKAFLHVKKDNVKAI